MASTLSTAAALFVVGCGSPADAASDVIVTDPWIRTTEETQRPDMTAMYVNLTNPTSTDITLLGADCGDVAQRYELHVMVEVDGEMVMQEAQDGIRVPKESHEHLAPGGPHVMLMDLTRELAVGSEEVECTLTFSHGQETTVEAPIMEFTEEQDTYHTH